MCTVKRACASMRHSQSETARSMRCAEASLEKTTRRQLTTAARVRKLRRVRCDVKAICLLTSVALLLLAAVPSSAQPVISAKSGVVAYTEGTVLLDNAVLEATSTKFPEMKENQVLRTEAGRAEVLLTPGVVVHLGENSSFRLITSRLIDTRVELLEGSAVVDALELAKDTNVTFVCKEASVTLGKAGHYRFDTEPARLRVYAGMVRVEVAGKQAEVSGGKAVGLGNAVLLTEKFDKDSTDSLDNWSRRRAEVMAMANVSAARSAYASSGGSNLWRWNPYFGMYTYLPGSGRFCDSFYGYCYWSPGTVNQVFYRPMPSMNTGFGGFTPSYRTMGATSTGYSGTMASAPAMSSAPAAAASSGSSAASSAGSSSVGRGSGGGGGRGH